MEQGETHGFSIGRRQFVRGPPQRWDWRAWPLRWGAPHEGWWKQANRPGHRRPMG